MSPVYGWLLFGLCNRRFVCISCGGFQFFYVSVGIFVEAWQTSFAAKFDFPALIGEHVGAAHFTQLCARHGTRFKRESFDGHCFIFGESRGNQGAHGERATGNTNQFFEGAQDFHAIFAFWDNFIAVPDCNTRKKEKSRKIFFLRDFLWNGVLKNEMKNKQHEPGDEELCSLLREARPTLELPAGFKNSVWHRIEAAELANVPAASWLDRAVGWLFRPRLAIASLIVLFALGASLGVVDGLSHSKQMDRDRYLTSVSPLSLRY
jgi:hypothetical protein